MSTNRNQAVDAVRLLAAFGVVIIHLSPSTPAAERVSQMLLGFAVPFFLTISLHFLFAKFRGQAVSGLGDFRLDRIVVPYVFWTIVYTGLRIVKHRMAGEPLGVDVISFGLYGGAAIHLYFMPLLLSLQCLAICLLLLGRSGTTLRLTGLAIGVIAVLFALGGHVSEQFGFKGFVSAGPAFLIGAFALGVLQNTQPGRRINCLAGIIACALIVGEAFFDKYLLPADWLRGPLYGYGVAALALNARLHATNRFVTYLLGCSYGIYLAHFGVLEGMEVVFKKTGVGLTPYSVVTKLILAVFICGCCAAFIRIARLHPITAYLALGESRRPGEQSAK